MSGYPNPNYAPMPTYPSSVGESCDNPKPYWFWKGGTFCGDATRNEAFLVRWTPERRGWGNTGTRDEL